MATPLAYCWYCCACRLCAYCCITAWLMEGRGAIWGWPPLAWAAGAWWGGAG